MLSRAQQILMKRAQKQACLSDAEYRELLDVELGFGVRSSTDASLENRHFDKFMAYVEAIFWLKVERRELNFDPLLAGKGAAPFQMPGYWERKNSATETSRDRFNRQGIAGAIAAREEELAALGCNAHYLAAIRRRVTRGSDSPHALHCYARALDRTLAVRRAKVEVPF